MKYKMPILFTITLLCIHQISFAQNILFIRGGSGTGGFLEGGADEQLSDINDKSTSNGNHGWYTLAETLRSQGYTLEQMIEGPASNNTPIPLSTMNLSKYQLIVFGSNNAEYSESDADAVEAYIKNGGAALFISDANWGRNWGDAPASDQTFLDRFGLIMNQDRGTYALRRSNNHFIIEGENRGDHPVLKDIDTFDGEGVSPITIHQNIDGVNAMVLAKAVERLRQNDSYSQGSLRDPTSDDGALVVAEVGLGRIACHFDRNTFFNRNGAGTNIHRFDNKQYAINLFSWLSGEPSSISYSNITIQNASNLNIDIYPTPTNSNIQIEISSKYNDQIRIYIYNVLGVHIASIFNGIVTANRNYRFSFDFSEQSTGMYYIKIVSGQKAITNRVLYVR